MDGHVDRIQLQTNGSLYTSGWIWKPDAPHAVIEVHVLFFNTRGQLVFGYPIRASRFRQDVFNHLRATGHPTATGNYGFSYTIPRNALPRGDLMVYLYAVDGSGAHPRLRRVNMWIN